MSGLSRGTAGLIPPDEPARIGAVRHLGILDTPPNGTFDRITGLAARIFDVPYTIVSVVDTDRIWFKSHTGSPTSPKSDVTPGWCLGNAAVRALDRR